MALCTWAVITNGNQMVLECNKVIMRKITSYKSYFQCLKVHLNDKDVQILNFCQDKNSQCYKIVLDLFTCSKYNLINCIDIIINNGYFSIYGYQISIRVNHK